MDYGGKARIYKVDIGNVLKKYRISANLTQEKLVDQLQLDTGYEIHRASYQSIEIGRTMPAFTFLVALRIMYNRYPRIEFSLDALADVIEPELLDATKHPKE